MNTVSEWNGVFFFKQKTAYEMRISDWSSDVCSSDLLFRWLLRRFRLGRLRCFLDLPQRPQEQVPHVADMAVQRPHAPPGGIDRRQHGDADRRWAHDEFILRRDIGGVVDDDRDDRHPRLHREVKGTLFEGFELWGQADRKSTRLNSSH